MCQQILQFCSGSTKPLLFVGGLLMFLLAIAIGYFGYDTNVLYYSIDPQVADSRSLGFHLQLAAAVYLVLVTVFCCYSAYFDQKHSIRALCGVTTLNLVLAVAAILLIPSGDEISKPFQGALEQAASKYNFSDASKLAANPALFPNLNVQSSTSPMATNSSVERPTRSTGGGSDTKATATMSSENATRMWDDLQARGCCGITNGTTDWKEKLGQIPKSCCATNLIENNHCKEIDLGHQKGCLALIGSTSLNLMIVLALIALVNLYLAAISGISAYKTYSYSEASQNAYT